MRNDSYVKAENIPPPQFLRCRLPSYTLTLQKLLVRTGVNYRLTESVPSRIQRLVPMNGSVIPLITSYTLKTEAVRCSEILVPIELQREITPNIFLFVIPFYLQSVPGLLWLLAIRRPSPAELTTIFYSLI
jgi:hypothetical protein